jgi:two-component system, LuxR family, response regulator FixJ
VLDGLVVGRLTKQIAYDLGISARTVEVHRARMLVRLGQALSPKRLVMAELALADIDAQAAPRRPLARAAEISERSVEGAFVSG